MNCPTCGSVLPKTGVCPNCKPVAAPRPTGSRPVAPPSGRPTGSRPVANAAPAPAAPARGATKAAVAAAQPEPEEPVESTRIITEDSIREMEAKAKGGPKRTGMVEQETKMLDDKKPAPSAVKTAAPKKDAKTAAAELRQKLSSRIDIADSSVTQEADEVFNEMKTGFAELGFGDKIGVVSAGGLFLFTFLPWLRGNALETLSGIDLPGNWFTLLLASLSLGLFFVREKFIPPAQQIYAYLAQWLFGLLAALYGVVFILNKTPTAQHFQLQVAPGTAMPGPMFGIYLIVAAGLGVLLGHLIAFATRR